MRSTTGNEKNQFIGIFYPIIIQDSRKKSQKHRKKSAQVFEG
jgi:hypothetical protein